MIYYPLSVLMNAGIREILIISTPEDSPRFEALLGDGHQFGIELSYAVQPSPDGLAQALYHRGGLHRKRFRGHDPGRQHLPRPRPYQAPSERRRPRRGAPRCSAIMWTIRSGSGIVEFDAEGKAVSLEEKPAHPKSNYCVTGLYFYDNRVVEYAKALKPSARGELEITDLNKIYLQNGELEVTLLGQGFTWLDTGTHESLVDATNFVKTVETHQHRKIACLEEIAYLRGLDHR